jgi:hypothetical protein
MTEREKLIDLLCYIPGAEEIADFFLANGVTIPVTCKDCKHYIYDDFDGCCVCMQLSKYVKPDFWCAYGERKDNG